LVKIQECKIFKGSQSYKWREFTQNIEVFSKKYEFIHKSSFFFLKRIFGEGGKVIIIVVIRKGFNYIRIQNLQQGKKFFYNYKGFVCLFG